MDTRQVGATDGSLKAKCGNLMTVRDKFKRAHRRSRMVSLSFG